MHAHPQTKDFLPVSPQGMELEYDGLLLRRDLASLEVRSQVIHPPKPAALPASLQTCSKTSLATCKLDEFACARTRTHAAQI